MKALKIIGIVVLVLGLLVVGGSTFLPNQTHIERSIVINAPTEKIFNELNTFNNLFEWSPWAKIDPTTQYQFSGPEYGVGAKYSWASDNPDVGSGMQEIVEITPNELVKTKMFFADMEGDQFAYFILNPIEGGINVTWTYDGEMDGIMNKYIGAFFMDMILGPSYEQGLADLKTYIEQLPSLEPEPEIVEADSAIVVEEEME